MVLLIDTNIIIDYLREREPWKESSGKILEMCSTGAVTGFVAAHTMTNLMYILRNHYKDADSNQQLIDLCRYLGVVGLTHSMIISALRNTEFTDKEDCLQYECASVVDAEYIITRNVKHFENSKIPAVTPEDFIVISPL
ncbi:MAG: PIN domain-containing protein [Spirochaetaceae bacterium]|jgi:predicted nucleic acid-binding protein|nr:PIN domain-containing protein [Spirochaetaceae bacterium]